ncbi:hypothetical protein AB0D71_41790 [Streptomyces avermitilis]|uniref:hypothetical protein n=1 Tax=Streptomyces avermitilis TaxID=33903 RepID=UPI0033EAF4B8
MVGPIAPGPNVSRSLTALATQAVLARPIETHLLGDLADARPVYFQDLPTVNHSFIIELRAAY